MTGWTPGTGGSGKTTTVGVSGLRMGAVRGMEESGKSVKVAVVLRKEV